MLTEQQRNAYLAPLTRNEALREEMQTIKERAQRTLADSRDTVDIYRAQGVVSGIDALIKRFATAAHALDTAKGNP